MEKVYSLNSAKSSSSFARKKPRSLKYYLNAGLHHKVVGKFATGWFFSQTEDVSEQTEKVSDKRMKIRNKSPAKKSNQPVAANLRKKGESARHDRLITGGAPGKFEYGPIANYSQTESDPTLIKNMVKLSNEVLASARTVFPIDPFPDSVVLDRTTLNITKRTFFFSNDTLSIRIEDILNAQVNVGPFLGSLTIASRILSSEDHFTINNLWRKDAVHLKHMIQGYVIALHNEIEISHLSREELIEAISELGHDLNT